MKNLRLYLVYRVSDYKLLDEIECFNAPLALSLYVQKMRNTYGVDILKSSLGVVKSTHWRAELVRR